MTRAAFGESVGYDSKRPYLRPFPGIPTDRMISRPDEQQDEAADDGLPPSKTRRKHEMHALQDLGEALVALDPRRLQQLDLPERLVDAIIQARGIRAHEGRRRQIQYIGKLMRTVDPAPAAGRARRLGQGSEGRQCALRRPGTLAGPAAGRAHGAQRIRGRVSAGRPPASGVPHPRRQPGAHARRSAAPLSRIVPAAEGRRGHREVAKPGGVFRDA